MRSKSRRFVEVALLALGAAGLGIWGWSVAREGLYEDWNNWVFDRQKSGQAESVRDYVHERITGSASSQNEPSQGKTKPPSGVIGRLKIPRLALQAMVREGTGEKTLSLALGHIAGTARPGQNGNVGVAGHRDSLFRGLRNIRVNDRVVFETSDGDTYLYQVNNTRIVKPNEVSVLNAGVYPELTLVTCYPFNYIGAAPDRFIVTARQIGQTTKETPVSELAVASPPAPGPEPPPPVRPVPVPRPALAFAIQPHPGPHRVPFELAMNHSRQLAPGVSIGLTRADTAHNKIDGWMWVMAGRRTIWLRDLSTRQPVIFYDSAGVRREVVIDSVSRNSIRGYLNL